jgi:hypothetical protein
MATLLGTLAELCSGLPETSEVCAEGQAQEEEIYSELGAQAAEEDAAISEVMAAENVEAFSTATDSAVFWSGLGEDGDGIAASYAAENGGTTLEQTEGASELPEYSPDDAASVAAWRAASESFARGASGNVRVLLGDSRPDSIWNTVELPTLQANPAVSSISAIDPVSGSSTLLWSR